MSSSTTEVITKEDVLRDYDIQFTPAPSTQSRNTQAPEIPTTGIQTVYNDGHETRDAPLPPHENPADWPDYYRQVPPYRPANSGRDLSLRPGGSHPIEQVFIFHMFEGVTFQVIGNRIWNNTFGRFNKSAFRFKIGGEI